MFCPNCATRNEEEHAFCRTCGLRLSGIAAELSEQRPSAETADLLRRKKLFERFWKVSISISGLVGAMVIVSIAVFYKLILFGPEILLGSALGAVVLFALLAAFFYAYPRLFLDKAARRDEVSDRDGPGHPADPTEKLLDRSEFEPASVTERSTELLKTPRRQ